MLRRAGGVVVLFLALFPVGLKPDAANHHLLLVLDGLRPDYVTPVNAASISTGAYPERHGILGNSVFFPRVDATRFLDTAQRADLERIQADQDGVLLTETTLGEALEANGKTMLAVGAGTTGAAFLLNHKVSG